MATATTITTRADGQVARPLSVLVPLIKRDIAEADEAGRPHYEAAADKLIEARDGHFQEKTAQFYVWAEKQFGRSRTTIRTWLAWGSTTQRKSFRNIEQFTFTPKEEGGLGKTPRGIAMRREWTAPIDAVAERARNEARRIRDETLTRQQERDAERALALRLIEIGFKVLAKELHPDKGGSRDAMARLSRVRDRLKLHA